MFLNEEEKSLKQKIEESIKLFYKMYSKFSLSKTKFDLDCHNHFQEIRFQLDLHREKLKEKIDDIYMEMINRTKEFEASYLKNFNEKFSSSLKSFEIKSYDEYLKEVEETFRDPKLLIKSIKGIYQKQEKTIATIQSTLKVMNHVKEDLKASNKFKPNVSFSFEKNLFGQLFLFDYQFDPFKSKILTAKQPIELVELCEFDSQNKFKLLYRASENGFESNDFHSKCDAHANTLTIFKASKSSYIFGGFTTASGEGNSGLKSDPHAFLFSLTNHENKPCKMKIDQNRNEMAIDCDSNCGPIFGDGDIIIFSNSNKNTKSNSRLGVSYNHSKYTFGTNEAESFLAGLYKFRLDEIEVYQKV